jgi:hypothetical protein
MSCRRPNEKGHPKVASSDAGVTLSQRCSIGVNERFSLPR